MIFSTSEGAARPVRMEENSARVRDGAVHLLAGLVENHVGHLGTHQRSFTSFGVVGCTLRRP
jgi:hypothetical protein